MKKLILLKRAFELFIHNLFHCPSIFFNKKIIVRHSLLTNVKFNIKGNSKITINGSILRDCIISVLNDDCNIVIENGCRIKNTRLYCEDAHSSITILPKCTIGGGELAATEGAHIFINEDCMFAEDIEIRNGDSHSIISKETGLRINSAKDVTIGKHVWIGAHVRILKGVSIPDNCVIANSSVVTKSQNNENTIYAGNPAKEIKKDIIWLRER